MLNFIRINKIANMIVRRTLFFILVLAFVIPLQAQKTMVNSFPDLDYYKGLELYNNEKYSAAQEFFTKVLDENGTEKSELRAGAMYYSAMCAIELFNMDAEYKVFEFVNQNPESQLINDANFRLAGFMYRKKTYAKTISYYDRVDRFVLNPEQLSEYYFNKGYSYYMLNDFENARVCFYEIKDTESKYSSPALYYYSHIAYDQKNYETALNGFLRLLDDPTFSSIAPYYVTQIYFMQQKYEKIVEFAPPLMDSISEKRAGEMAKIIGDSYFALERYKEALPYLEQYRDDNKTLTIGDRYQLAFIYYKSAKYKEASELFESIAYTNSEISQSAMYNLADCYLKTGDKNKARKAFSIAAGMDYNLVIQEDALFNYAKVTYELSYNPFNEAIQAFNRYLSLYPASKRSDEAYNFLVAAYLNTRNYKMAMESLEKIKEKDSDMEKALQRVSFFRGLELFTNLRFTEAIVSFDRSLKYSKYDGSIKARTLYWLGEAYFRLNDPTTAEDFYNQFKADPFAYKVIEYPMLNYSLGYVAFSKKDYANSQRWFTTYTSLEKNTSAVTLADAYNRLGDTRFIDSRYADAIELYSKVIQMNKADVDYAYFQKGFCQGLIDQPKQKIETFNKLIRDYSKSAYVDDALFELGKTYAQLNLSDDAIKSYQRVATEFPNSNYMSRTLVQLGLISNNSGNSAQALNYYKQVVRDYPGTTESSNSLKSIKDIYVNQNNVDSYLAYVEELGKAISMMEQDSLIYSAAENSYLAGDCVKAIQSLDNYISRFANGNFLLNAHYYRADCLLKQNREDESFASLEYIISQPVNMFSEPALVAATRISFGKADYNRAAELYSKLIEVGEKKANISEAEIGLMRCYVKLDEYQNSIAAANQVLLQDKLQAEIAREARFIIANAFLKQNDSPAALDWFTKVAVEVNSKEGAESKYRVAELTFIQGDKKKAEDVIYEFIDMNTPHAYWMGKSFLLLADIFQSNGDDFQALQTLQSVIDYYTEENDGIKTTAIEAKKVITDKANAREIAPVAEPMEIKVQ
jgi:TolA-binding protein